MCVDNESPPIRKNPLLRRALMSFISGWWGTMGAIGAGYVVAKWVSLVEVLSNVKWRGDGQ